MSNYKGSEWRKWDMHLHCPTSIFNNQFAADSEEEKWDRYCSKLEEVTEISVIGITDYFSIDGYLKIIEYQKSGRIPNVFILPNIELRILPTTEIEKAINLHIIISPDIAGDIDNVLFSKLEFSYQLETYTCTFENLVKLGRKVSDNDLMEERSAYREGCNQFKVDIEKLKSIVNKSLTLKSNSIFCVSNSNRDGNSGIKDSGLLAIRQEIYRFCDIIFSGNPNDRTYFLGEGSDSKEEVIRKYGGLKPCIHGSDAHSFEKILLPDLNRFTWIKADPSFEGLKQIIFEPKHRVIITEHKPYDPLIWLRKATFNFPENTLLNDEKFCFSNNHEFQFSPNFTCLIGGRGTGKSMIINMLHEKTAPGSNEFFKDRLLKLPSGERISINECVNTGTEVDANHIEFINQNEIQRLADDHLLFTESIYSRIKKFDSEQYLENLEKEFIIKDQFLQDRIKTIVSFEKKFQQLDEKEKELGTQKAIVESFQNPRYDELTQTIKELSEKLSEYTTSKEDYYALVAILKNLINQYDSKAVNNEYDIAFAGIIDKVKNITVSEDKVDFTQMDKLISDLDNKLKLANIDLSLYLTDRGVSKENLNDVASANSKIILLESEIKLLGNEILNLEKEIKEFRPDPFIAQKDEYIMRITSKTEEINEQLAAINSPYIKTISLKYEFDYDTAETSIFNDFKEIFSDQLTGVGAKDPFLNVLLFKINPNEVYDRQALIHAISTDGSTSKAKQWLVDLFSNVYNFEIYTTIILRHLFNTFKYKTIRVSYDARRIEDSSFGQRSTATLVILLQLGNKPIVIDEPEAHLDSLLISNYLVDLIKEKKNNRQIIFTTHNANFVINGDAELIHILEMDEHNVTQITSTSIENKSTRKSLIGLEGGKEAFISRENKYFINEIL